MKIDTTKIDGFEEMTAEEKVAALTSFEYEDNSTELANLKKIVSDRNSEVADYKKKLKERMTDDELKAKEAADKQAELQTNYDALLKKVNLAENKAKFIGLGYDEKLAEETATALVEGNMEVVFANQGKHQEALAKAIKGEVLAGTPRPQGGNQGAPAVSQEQFNAMGYTDRVKLKRENPELYQILNKGEN